MGGISFDPKLQYLFANTENVMWTTAVIDRSGRKRVEGPDLPGAMSRYTFSGYNKFHDPDGYPATAWPWGHLTAIDLKTGKFAWRIPFGTYPELVAKGLKDTGSESYGGAVVTASGLLIIGASDFDRKMHAFDSKTGSCCCGKPSCLTPAMPRPSPIWWGPSSMSPLPPAPAMTARRPRAAPLSPTRWGIKLAPCAYSS